MNGVLLLLKKCEQGTFNFRDISRYYPLERNENHKPTFRAEHIVTPRLSLICTTFYISRKIFYLTSIK